MPCRGGSGYGPHIGTHDIIEGPRSVDGRVLLQREHGQGTQKHQILIYRGLILHYTKTATVKVGIKPGTS